MSDYPGAIDFPAHPTNTLGPPCTPKGWVLHTPEEAADGDPGTPYWFAQHHPGQEGSTTYFVSYLGFVYQCVPENVAAIANGVLGKPYPAWASPNVSLNRQTLSVEIEGYAATIANTISPAQKTAVINLLAYGSDKYGFPRDRAHIIGHYQVASNRSDPGTLDIDEIVALLQEDDVPTQQEWDDFKRENAENHGTLNGYINNVQSDLNNFKQAEAQANAAMFNDLLTVMSEMSKGGDVDATIAEIQERLKD